MEVKFHLPGLRGNYPLNMLLLSLLEQRPDFFREGIKMPSAKFVRVSKIVDTFRTSSIKGQFDIPNMEEVKTEFR